MWYSDDEYVIKGLPKSTECTTPGVNHKVWTLGDNSMSM